tara:strand:- start:408 stop:1388 length:981 start_codon:yes stop_codon:yes gene_type:complete
MTSAKMMTTALEQSYIEFGRALVETLSSKYGFDENEALDHLSMNVKVKRVSKTKKEKVLVPSIPLPFCNKIIEGCCMGIRPNHGLYTQCQQKPMKENEYCKTCNKHAETNESKKPKNGNIKDRVDKTDWRSPDGKTPTNYGNVMKKLNITREKAEEEASKMNWTISEIEYEEKKKKAGRPKSPATTDTDDENPKKKRGRPAKKEKRNVVTKNNNVGDSVIEELMSQLNINDDTSDDEKESKNDDKETQSDDELSSQPDMMEAVISEPLQDNDSPECSLFEFNGIKYYKDKKTNELYEYGDEDDAELIGIFNEEKQCIEPIEDEEED